MLSKFLQRFTLPLALSVALAAAPVMAQQSQGMQHDMPNTPASRAYMQSMENMNKAMMSQPMTGDADHDFASMMRLHHQAAVDMAKVEIQYGKDPEMKKMAEKVVADQSKEIKELSTWLERHPVQR
ncbi:hypothetical protein SAE02_69250 [Skermanella aerolata]|uniref:DUF305 domain-containing protein n=1 Tax=Skermanella aerolata TaxID=393310 RepID=A0A512E246_9PROT|nr:DUF305 domain-containing protein [Skermanella aerolata]KJB91152.1 hypothetical protein N826_31950 [Skermanella aerolata KACC 11604]GEO42777.1 hypothetical protein SAE02_69250 [Skermanella aerolata]